MVGPAAGYFGSAHLLTNAVKCILFSPLSKNAIISPWQKSSELENLVKDNDCQVSGKGAEKGKIMSYSVCQDVMLINPVFMNGDEAMTRHFFIKVYC